MIKAGIFLFRVANMITAFEILAPYNFKLTKYSFETAQVDLGFIRINPQPWSETEDISLDYAIIRVGQEFSSYPLFIKMV